MKDASIFLVDILYSYFIKKEFEYSVIEEFCVCLWRIECLTISVNISDFLKNTHGKYFMNIKFNHYFVSLFLYT